MTRRHRIVRVPASSANLGPGFDSMAAALAIQLELEVEETGETRVDAGDADLPSDQAHAYFTKLANAPYKRFIELGEGTHTIIMEKNRMQFFREVMNFLNEADPLALN